MYSKYEAKPSLSQMWSHLGQKYKGRCFYFVPTLSALVS